MKTLTKYMFKEIVPNYFIGLAFFTLILLINEIFRLVAMVVEKNIPIVRVLELFIYTLPYILAVTIPIGVLIGIIFAIGRLSSDSEVTAMRASGVSLFQVFIPCYWFGLIITISSILFFQFVLPWGNQSYMQMYYKIIRGNPAVNLMQNQVLDIEGLKIMVDSVDVANQELFKVRIIDRMNNKIIFAEWGRFLPRDDENNVFPLQLFYTTTQPYIYFPQQLQQERSVDSNRLKRRFDKDRIITQIASIDKGLDEIQKLMLNRQLTTDEVRARESLLLQKKMYSADLKRLEKEEERDESETPKYTLFEERWDEISIIYIKDTTPINPQFSGPQMASISDLLEHIEKTRLYIKVTQIKLINNLVNVDVEIRKFMKKFNENSTDQQLINEKNQLDVKRKRIENQVEHYHSGATIDKQMIYQFHNKLSIPLACFFFAVIAAPLGIFSKRSGKGIGIGIALLVLMAYRTFMLFGQIGYTKETFSPAFGAWFPNFFMAFAGIYFTYSKITGRSIHIHVDWLTELIAKMKKWWERKNITFMQLVLYTFAFPVRFPIKLGIRFYKWQKLRKKVAKSGTRVSFKARYDDIFAEVIYSERNQSYPNKRITRA